MLLLLAVFAGACHFLCMRPDDARALAMRTAIQEWTPLSESQWNTLSHIFEVRPYSKGEHIHLPGSTRYELLFVSEGLLRFYYIGDDGNESNKAFLAEHSFGGPLAAASLELPLIYGIEALEATTVLVAPYASFRALFDVDPVFDRLARNLAELLLVRKELRTRSLLQQSATERFLEFIEKTPDLMKRVPQYHVASYLGITAVSLSRLRAGLVKEKTA